MTTTTIQTLTRASFDRDLTNMHALSSAPVLSITASGSGVDFERALRNARFWPTPWVLQQRTEDGTVLSAINVTRSIGTEAEVRLFIPGTGPDRAGSWQENSLTVEVGQMTGENWFTVDSGELAGIVATVEAANRAAAESVLIPRTAEAAEARARVLRLYGLTGQAAALDRLAEWLPGGSRNQQGHELAVDLDLCGEYEAAVCPTLGWLPRRGAGNSRANLCNYWHDALDAIEVEAAGDPSVAINAAIGRYDQDGTVNRAIVEHAENHLESHKRPGVNALLRDLGMTEIGVEREYEVEMRVERSRTVTEYAIVTVTVTASDDDEARDAAYESYGDELDYANWIVEDDHYDSDVTDAYVEDVTVV